MLLPPEIESGNKEYKLKLISNDPNRIEQLASQMKWRLNEGNGVAEYYLGVADNGQIMNISANDFKISIKNFIKIIKIIDAKIISNEKIKHNNLYYHLIKIESSNKLIQSLNILFIGPQSSGKSTIIGNLTRNMKDNGFGKSRKFVFNHKHEIYSGETSSISIQNKQIHNDNKIINLNLIDTPGKKKYMKATICALCKYQPDILFLVIDPLNIKVDDLKFFIELLNFNKYNYYILLTKKDIYKTFHKNYILKNILDIYNKNKISYIEISNITNKGYNKIYKIFRKNYIKNNKDINIQVCDILSIPNFPTIYTGLTFTDIDLNKKYILNTSNIQKNIKISSIYFLDKPKSKIESGHLVTFTINNQDIDNKTDIIITSKNIKRNKSIHFTYDIDILHNQGICIYNNQYNIVKIYKNNNKYTLTNIDNSNFINLDNKIILKIDNQYHFINL